MTCFYSDRQPIGLYNPRGGFRDAQRDIDRHVNARQLIDPPVRISFTHMMEGFPSLAHTSFVTIGILRTGGRATHAFIQMLLYGTLIGPVGPSISKYRPLIPIVVIVVILIYEPKGVTSILARGSVAIKRIRDSVKWTPRPGDSAPMQVV